MCEYSPENGMFAPCTIARREVRMSWINQDAVNRLHGYPRTGATPHAGPRMTNVTVTLPTATMVEATRRALRRGWSLEQYLSAEAIKFFKESKPKTILEIVHENGLEEEFSELILKIFKEAMQPTCATEGGVLPFND